MSRDYKVYLDDIATAIDKIAAFTRGLPKDAFAQDAKTFDAVVRNLEILGEAAKNIPEDVRRKFSEVPWRMRPVCETFWPTNILPLIPTLFGISFRTSCRPFAYKSSGYWRVEHRAASRDEKVTKTAKERR